MLNYIVTQSFRALSQRAGQLFIELEGTVSSIQQHRWNPLSKINPPYNEKKLYFLTAETNGGGHSSQ
jgi:hypothetical protein